MSLSGTATSVGTQTTMESIYLSDAPEVWIQDTDGAYRFGPDSDGFYWGLSGTASFPAIKLGCFTDFVFGDDVVMNDVICDASGVEAVIQSRQSVHVNFTLESLFPLSVLTSLLRLGVVTANTTDDAEKVGIGDSTRKNEYWRMYFSRVYDPDTNDFVSVTIHKGQFVDAWEVAAPYGDKWTIPLKFRGLADSSKPAAQKFATIVRVDPSVLG